LVVLFLRFILCPFLCLLLILPLFLILVFERDVFCYILIYDELSLPNPHSKVHAEKWCGPLF